MKIAIHARDLDSDRIDGTRVYLYNVLKQFTSLEEVEDFFVYHGKKFNPALALPESENFTIKSLSEMPFWTQSIFAWNIGKDRPDALWMPMHNIPFFKSKKIRTVVTIHDLAFKYFPKHFTKKDLLKLNFLAGQAINRSDHIIAVSQSTKDDILKFYPKIKEEKITVIHHGFDAELFQKEISQKDGAQILDKYKLKSKNYILYVGAIQPRKNLNILIEAFEKIKQEKKDLKLVLAGAPAWMHERTMEKISSSIFANDIIVTGTIPFEWQPVLYQNASAFVFPSLYEGFGIPLLEAMASGTPVICADNSSFPEVAGEAALYFDARSEKDLVEKINAVLDDKKKAARLRLKGLERVKLFSWEKCARETLAVLKNKKSIKG